jgi:hypothetical protein
MLRNNTRLRLPSSLRWPKEQRKSNKCMNNTNRINKKTKPWRIESPQDVTLMGVRPPPLMNKEILTLAEM